MGQDGATRRGRRLDGEVALVTGGTKGIGAAIVGRLVEQDCKVVFTGRDEVAGTARESELRDGGADARFIRVDVADPSSVRDSVDSAAATFGKLSVLVNVTESNWPKVPPVEGADDFESGLLAWQRSFELSLVGARYAPVAAGVPHLIEAGGGSIINIGSVAGIRGYTNGSARALAKGAEVALTRAWAVQHRAHNIRCNALLSAFVGGDYVEVDEATASVWRRAHLLGQGRPDDLAHAAVWLASQESRWVTGQVIAIDGGLTCYLPFIPMLEDEAYMDLVRGSLGD